MKTIIFSTIVLLTLFACGQTPKSDKAVISQASSVSKDTITIYRNISTELCSCTFSTMKNNKPSTSMDSCYRNVLLKYEDTLKQLGFDPATQAGQLKLSNEVFGKLYFTCHDIYVLMEKEFEDENAKKMLFTGELVSQIKLPSGLYEIKMKNKKSLETKTFFAKSPLDETQIKKYEPGYEMTVEYEVIKNPKTSKDEFYLKEDGKVMSVGAVKVENQK